MNQKIVLLSKKRDELVNQYKRECDRIYKDLYEEDITALNKQINQIQYEEVNKRKEWGI